MIRAAASQVIRRPVGEVFAFATDATNEPRWHTDVLEVAPTSPTASGPAAAGATYRWVVDFMGRKDMHMRVVQVEPDRREVLQATAGPMLPTLTYTFEPQDGGTTFTRTVEIEPRGFMRLMAPMLRGMVAKRNAQFVANLKRVLEAEHVP